MKHESRMLGRRQQVSVSVAAPSGWVATSERGSERSGHVHVQGAAQARKGMQSVSLSAMCVPAA